ncbi:MAG: 3-hydroxyacyl-CoA dehydrogenase NAD-binding domain-containing protein [Pseudomonadota bacterium]
MALEMFGKKIEKIGIVGSGNIGPDIALFFAQGLRAGVPVVVVDVVQDALDQGKKRIEGKIKKGVDKGKIKPPVAESILGSITWTLDYGRLKDATLIVEAATENVEIKHRIFAQLEEVCGDDTIMASNSSHMEPEVIFEKMKNKGRTLVNHYFFPAERNIIVEVVPGKDTDGAATDFMMKFYEQTGKVPIKVGSRYGYAVDPVFEGLFQAAALCVEAGMGSVKEVDTAAAKALKMGVGPFTAMNLTGGNPITSHGLDQMNEKVNAGFKTPKLMHDAMESGKPWEVAGRGEKVELPPEKQEAIGNEMMGAYFGLVTEILGSGISNVSDLELAVTTALVVAPPFAFMNRIGVGNALELVEAYAKKHPDFPVPGALRKQAGSGSPWEIPVVLREDVDGVAVLKIRRPTVLNALNRGVMEELRAKFTAVRDDASIKAAVLTGFGTRAFVSGADIKELAAIDDPELGAAFSWKGQEVLLLIENLGKPVIAALGGLAFGGGCEISMACSARISVKTKMLVGQPEPKLGIIPGYGGTQRFPRWVGLANAWKILRDGNPISSAQAKEIGLIREEVDGDVVGAAVALARDAADGKAALPSIPRDPIEVPESLPGVDIGHLSKKIDEIMCKAILEGAKMNLEDGLRHEARMFGECIGTEDMKIGMENFLKNGPKVNAGFKHK